MTTVVVYVHGLWHRGAESLLLRRRLARELGAQTCAFSYSSVRDDIATSSRALGRFLQTLDADTLHIVAHSLGGLVTLDFFERWVNDGRFENGAAIAPGRVVLLGSPVRGSLTARRLARVAMGRGVLGKTVRDVLLEPRAPRWSADRELGVIAGDRAFGLGRLIGRLDSANDGTVLVDETHVEGAADQTRLRLSHSGMVFSVSLAREVARFLRDGRFTAPRAESR